MKSAKRWSAIFTISLVMLVGAVSAGGSLGCGGGGGSTGDDALASTNDTFTLAMDALKAGEIRQANEFFSEIISSNTTMDSALALSKSTLDLTTIITQSHFGRALTDSIMLAESQPVTDILAGFGQMAWSIDTVFGSTGYLSAAYDINKTDEFIVTLSGTVSANVNAGYSYTRPSLSGTTYGNGESSSSAGAYAEIRTAETISVFPLRIYLLGNVTGSAGVTMTGLCQLNVGDVITSSSVCDMTTDGGTNTSRAIQITTSDGYRFLQDQSGGTIAVSQAGISAGSTLSLTFNNVELITTTNDVITLNGTFIDSIHDSKASGVALPFGTVCNKRSCIVSQVANGYRSSDVITTLNDLIPFYDGIIVDLETAVADTNASFDIPKELYFGAADMHVTRADMLAMLAGMYGGKAGTNLSNSWTADFRLDGLVAADGSFIGDRAQIVNELNTFFELRSDHQLAQARDNMTTSFSYAQQSLELLLTGVTGGLMDASSEAEPLYQDILDMLLSAISSLGGNTTVAHISPLITANLDYVLSGNVDGAAIQSDAFVLENNKIKPVEAYFSQLMSNACSHDLATRRADMEVLSASVRAVRHMVQKAFPTINPSMIAGYKLNEIRN